MHRSTKTYKKADLARYISLLAGASTLMLGNSFIAPRSTIHLWLWITSTVGPTAYLLVPLACYALAGLVYLSITPMTTSEHRRVSNHLRTVGGTAFAAGLMGTDLVLVMFNVHANTPMSSKILVAFGSTLVGLVVNTTVVQGLDLIDLAKNSFSARRADSIPQKEE